MNRIGSFASIVFALVIAVPAIGHGQARGSATLPDQVQIPCLPEQARIPPESARTPCLPEQEQTPSPLTEGQNPVTIAGSASPTASIPEPTTMGMLGLGALGLLANAYRRRRNKP